jgi:hypothetical protein
MGIAKVQSLETRKVHGSMELSDTVFTCSQDRNTYHERDGKDSSCHQRCLPFALATWKERKSLQPNSSC